MNEIFNDTTVYNISSLTIDEYKVVLEKLHSSILEIGIEIRRICKENNIKYFIIGGSLLGAIRHKGFIPWDDDMDIGMIREDYEKFILVCKDQLNEKFTILTTDIENYGLPFAKIQLKNTLFLEKDAPVYKEGNGIFVDVFPVDKIPENSFLRKKHKIISGIIRYALLLKSEYIDPNKNVNFIKNVITIYCRIHTRESIIKKMQRIATKYNKSNSLIYYNTGSAYEYGREVFPSESITGQISEIEFEKEIFSCPNNPDIILKMLYGDYMKLPPEEKRYNRHGVQKICFNTAIMVRK